MSEQEMKPEDEVHAEAGQEPVEKPAGADQAAAENREEGSLPEVDALKAVGVEETDITPIIEALIFAAEDALTEKQIVSIIADTVGTTVTPAQIARSVEKLNGAYDTAGRAFRIHVWGGGYRMATTPDFAPFVKTLYYQQKVTKLSRSLLETLAILAYKQPATKPELDYVRGVDCDHALRRLLEMGLVEIGGRADTVGRPLLYQTTPEFMDKFGLSSIDDLPTLREIEELMEDPSYSKEHARLLFREGLGLEGEPETEEGDSTVDSDSSGSGPIDVDIEGDGAVGSTDGYVLGSGPDPTQPE